MEVREFEGSEAEWDGFVTACDGWTHMHLIGWRQVISDVFGHDCYYLVALVEGEIRGVLPLVTIRSPVFGRFLVSMPFLNYGGPLGAPDAIRQLVAAAVELADKMNIDLLELRSRGRLDIPLPDSARKITVTMPLVPNDPDALWGRFSSKFRNKLKRSTRDGVEVRFGPDQIDAFYSVFRHHMRDLGTPTLPRRLFEAVAERFGESSWFGCAYLEDRPIAGGCALSWGDEVEMTWSAARREFSHLRPNGHLYWSFMERACSEGYSTFNFGRCTPGSGTHTFKRSWAGADDEPLHWYFRSDDRSATPTPDDPSFSWGPRLWKRLPVPLASALGPQIIKYIP
jgi:serine/alanine adding enzyme